MNDPEIMQSDDESLVAYLDGELSREERDQIENRLVADDFLRARLQSLQRSWDLLDWLPSPAVDEGSVETTLRLVVADLAQNSGSELPGVATALTSTTSHLRTRPDTVSRPTGRFWSRALIMIAVPLLVAGIVFSLVRWNQNRELRRQVADFPVALDMDVYRLSDNPGLIDDLIAAPRWRSVVGGLITPDVDDVVDPQSSLSIYSGPDGEARIPSSTELAARLHEVPAEQRMIALARWDRFNRLDEPSQASLRAAATRLRTSENAAERLDTLRRYVRMRDQLSDQLVDQIENGPPEDRSMAIDAAIGEMIASIGRVTRRNLSEDAIERIDFTVIQLVKSRLRDVAEDGEPTPAQEYFEAIEERFRRRDDPYFSYRWFALNTLARDSNWHSRDGRSQRSDAPQNKIPPLSHRELETIRSMLPSNDLDTLQQYVSDPWIQSMILRDWATEAVQRKIRGQAKPLSLAEQYQRMPPEQRERLDLATPEEARKILIDGM